MRCARPTPPRTTRATGRFGSSLSPAVTSLARALTPALVAEPASRPAGKQQTFCTSKSPRLTAGGFFQGPRPCDQDMEQSATVLFHPLTTEVRMLNNLGGRQSCND